MSDETAMQSVVVRMPTDLVEQVKRISDEEDRTMSQTIRRAVKQYLQGLRPA